MAPSPRYCGRPNIEQVPTGESGALILLFANKFHVYFFNSSLPLATLGGVLGIPRGSCLAFRDFSPLTTRFRAAYCMHCMRRLCVDMGTLRITEMEIRSSGKNLRNDLSQRRPAIIP